MTNELEEIKSLAEFQKEISNLTGIEFVYRGQSDESWYVTSTAYRRLKGRKGKSFTRKLIKYHKDLIYNARNYKQVLESEADIDLLARLQHYGAATSLIDFSYSSLVALWFACQDSTKDGKVFCLNTTDPDDVLEIKLQAKEKSIENVLLLDFIDNKNIKAVKWQPPFSNDRVIKQESVFILNQSGKIEDTDFSEMFTVLKKHKEEILNDLEKLSGITETRIYPDFYGFVQSNAHNKPYDAKTLVEIYRRGLEHQRAGRLKEAMEDYNKTIELTQKSPYPYNNRGTVKLVLGHPEDAIKDFTQAIKLKPNYAVSYKCRGVAYATMYYNKRNEKNRLQYYDLAIEDYSLAKEIFSRQGDIDQAKECEDRINELKANDQTQ